MAAVFLAHDLRHDRPVALKLLHPEIVIGTPAYMSPEQASGERNLDARTDVYALGCVLYEMLAGEPPFTGPTAQAIIARALTETPRPIHPSRARVPEGMDTVFAKAVAVTPGDRYPSAAEFARALGTGGGPETADAHGGEHGGAKLVAVLPFENLGSPEDDYFADGVTDEVRGKLAVLSPGWLKIDPNFNPLRGNPRFEHLVGGH